MKEEDYRVHDMRKLLYRMGSFSLNLSLVCLRSALKTTAKARDLHWAHELCTVSRFIHVGIWRELPGREWVRQEVLPLLERAQREFTDTGECVRLDKKAKEKMRHYCRNLELRMQNIVENYLQGKPSAFITNSAIGTTIQKRRLEGSSK